MLMNICNSIIKRAKEIGKQNERQRLYDDLLETPYLHSSQYLNELYTQAKNKSQEDAVLEHLNRHQAWEDGYMDLTQKAIDKRWRSRS